MEDLLDRLRARSRKERRIISLGVAGSIVAVIMVIWTASFIGELKLATSEPASAPAEQRASLLETIKHKAGLLFDKDGDGRSFELFDRPVEYQQGTGEGAPTTSPGRDLGELLREFNASSSGSLSSTSTGDR